MWRSFGRTDRGRGIVSVYSLYASRTGTGIRPFTYRPTYVHAKVGIVVDPKVVITISRRMVHPFSVIRAGAGRPAAEHAMITCTT